jgi:hypothetical protein
MSDSSAFVRPAPMECHGTYNRSSRVQAAGLSPAVPLLEQAVYSDDYKSPVATIIFPQLAGWEASDGDRPRRQPSSKLGAAPP